MDAKSWIFSFLTAAGLAVSAIIVFFIMLIGMERLPASKTTPMYIAYFALAVFVIVVSAFCGGFLSSWAAKKLFPAKDWVGFVLCPAVSFLAFIVGSFILFVGSAGIFSMFDK